MPVLYWQNMKMIVPGGEAERVPIIFVLTSLLKVIDYLITIYGLSEDYKLEK